MVDGDTWGPKHHQGSPVREEMPVPQEKNKVLSQDWITAGLLRQKGLAWGVLRKRAEANIYKRLEEEGHDCVQNQQEVLHEMRINIKGKSGQDRALHMELTSWRPYVLI